MRVFGIFLLMLGLVACSSSETTQEVSGEFQPPLPEGAVTSPSDRPGMINVSIADNAGKNLLTGMYVDNKREGSWVEYHNNGLIKSITTYVGGLKEGLFAEFNEQGQTVRRCLYHLDQREGEYREFNYSTVKEERFYKAGKLEGAVKIYYPDGKVMEEGVYVNGLRDGISRWYDQAGNVTIEYEYNAGQLVKK